MSIKLELGHDITSHILNEANKVSFEQCLPTLIQAILTVEGWEYSLLFLLFEKYFNQNIE